TGNLARRLLPVPLSDGPFPGHRGDKRYTRPAPGASRARPVPAYPQRGQTGDFRKVWLDEADVKCYIILRECDSTGHVRRSVNQRERDLGACTGPNFGSPEERSVNGRGCPE